MGVEQTISLKVLVDNKQGMASADQLGKAFTSAVNPKSYGAGAKASAAKASGQGETKTARSVGASAGTGSAASDFAAQASGLGGLVHVYATFAANIFAVSAAFNALSKAMDITNLVKGLDQIGASSGRNLGSLAKQMVAVADGAISMQQAMTSTAMASAGGMTNQAILRMTEVAKKASLALGRDMTDSMDRLTKGIVKTQPELLDELGIMTRVIPAQQEYARQIGKTAASLTDFEKRQAFANAVLAEGERKFGAIGMDANPYSKVLASMQNIIQVGLELVNKVLGPLMSMLSSSPTALATTMAGLAAVLLKQAMPAIGSMRENSKRYAAETSARLKTQIAEMEAAGLRSDEIVEQHAAKQFLTHDKTQKAIASLPKKYSRNVVGSEVQGLLYKSPFDISDAQEAKISAKHEELASKLAKNELSHEETIALKKLDSRKASLLDIQKLQADYALKAREDNIKNDESNSIHYASMQKKKFAMARAEAKANILANAADNAAIMGPSFAFSKLREDVNNSGASRVSKSLTMIQGSASIATTAISNLMNIYGMYLAIATAAFAVLDNLLSTSKKEAEAYAGSLDTLNSSLDNVSRTLEVINKKDLSNFLSVESTQAKANALNDLSGSLSGAVDKFIKLQRAQSGWDRFFDGFWDMFGKGSADKLALGVSNTVVDAMKLMAEGPAKDQARKDIASLFDQPVNFDNVEKFNESLKDLDKEVVASKAKSISVILDTASRAANNAAAALTSFKTALGEVDKQATIISNSLMPLDDISKMGIALNTSASSMATALKDPIDGLTALRELAGDAKALSFLPPGLAVELGTAKKKLDDLSSSLAAAQKEQLDAQAKLAKAKADLDKVGGELSKNPLEVDHNYSARKTAQDTRDLEEERLKLANQRIAADTQGAKDVVTKYKDISRELASAGFEKMAQGLNKALAEAGVSAAKGYLDTIKSAGGFTAEMEADLTKKQIAIQIEDIKSKYNNTIALANLTLEIQRNTLETEKANVIKQMERPSADTNALNERYKVLEQNIREVDLAKSISKTGSKAVRAYANAANSQDAASELKNAMGMLTDVVAQSFGKDSMLAKLFGDMNNADLAKQAGKITDDSNKEKQRLSNEGKQLGTVANDLANIQALNGMYNEQLQLSKEINSEALLRNKFAQEEEDINRNIKINKIALDTLKKGGKEYDEASRNATALSLQLLTTQKDKQSQLNILFSKNLQERTVGQKALQEMETAFQNKRKQNELDLKAAQDTEQESKLSYYKEIGAISEEEYIRESATIKQNAEARKFEQEIVLLKQAQSKEEQHIQDIIKATQASKDTKVKAGEAVTNENAVLAQQTQLLANNKVINEGILVSKIAQNTATQQAIALQTTQNEQAAMYKGIMDSMVSVTANLSTIFGEWGDSVGKSGEALAKLALDEEKYLKDKKDLQDKIDKGDTNSKETIADRVALATLEKKNTKDQISNIGAVAGATKKMFNEKSAGYKVLDAVQKASAAVSMALTIKDLGIKLSAYATEISAAVAKEATQTGIAEAGFLARLPIYIKAIYASWGSMGPWMVGAAALFIAAQLGADGGGGSVDTTGLTAEDRQKTQGTGTTFGDSSAKSQSIQNSLDLIAATTVEGMSYENETVRLLTSINDNIGIAARNLYQTKGISSGTDFGVTEGSSKSGGWLFGSTNTDTTVIDSGIRLRGSFMDLARAGESSAAALDKYQDTLTTRTSTGFLGGIFGGGGTSSSIQNDIKALDQATREAIGSIFSNAARLFINQGNRLGMTTTQITENLSQIPVDKLASLRGLKGAELQTELNAVIGGILDDTAKKLFPQLDQFKKFGEGYSQTVTRVLDTNDKINLSFKQMGMAMLNFPKTTAVASQAMKDAVTAAERDLAESRAKVSAFTPTTTPSSLDGGAPIVSTIDPKLTQDVTDAETRLAAARQAVLDVTKQNSVFDLAFTESLANAAGGVDKFLELTASFTDKYLTDEEKFGPRRAALTEQLDKMGLSTDLTKEKLKSLILNYQFEQDAQGKVSDASAAGYVELLKLAEAMDASSQSAANLASTYGAGGDVFARIIDEARKAGDDAESAGYSIADALIFSVENAMYDEALSRIGAVMLDTVITPMITSIMAGSFAADVASGAFDQMLADAIAMSATISAAFSDPAFISAIETIMQTIGDSLEGLVDRIPSRPVDHNARDRAAAEKSKREAESAIEKAKSALLAEYNKQVSALTSVISAIRSSIKALKDYKNSLLIGPSSTLAPSEKYAQTKSRFDELTRLASMTAVTDAEKAAKADALAKLPEASDAFLAASRAMFASGEQYNRDFQRVLDVIDSTTALLETQLSDAEQQLEVLKSNTTILSLISDNTKSMEVLLREYLDAVANGGGVGGGGGGTGGLPPSGPERAAMIKDYIDKLPKDAANIEGSTKKAFDAAKANKVSMQEIANAMGVSLLEVQKYFAQYGYAASEFYGGPAKRSSASADKLAAIKSYIDEKLASTSEADMPAAVRAAYDYAKEQRVTQADVAKAMGMQILDVQKFFAKYDIPAFSAGGLAKGVSLVGEKGPEIVDFVNPGRVYSNQASNDLFNTKELVAEIKNLRKEVADLRKEQQQQTNQLVVANYDANMRASSKVAEATQEAAEQQAWASRSAVRIA